MAWSRELIPDLSGRTVVVTGANAGLGLAVAEGLAARRARVVMAVRDVAKAEEARRVIARRVPDPLLDIVPIDLSSLESVRRAAGEIARTRPAIDALVANAGVMAIPRRSSVDGHEMQLAVNHLGHFLLAARLLPSLLEAGAGRIVSVTSFGRIAGRPLDGEDPNLESGYDPWRAYGQAKLAVLHFAIELDRRLRGAGADAVSVAAHPGLAHTDLQSHSVRATGGGVTQRFWHLAARTVGADPAEGARPLLMAATDPDAAGGELYGPRWLLRGAPVRRVPRRVDQATLETMWAVSERLVGESFDVAGLVGR